MHPQSVPNEPPMRPQCVPNAQYTEKTKHSKLKIWLQVHFISFFCRFRTLIRPYYRGAAGIVLVYDVTDEKTFHNIEEWMQCIVENTQQCQIIQKVLLANKMDLNSDLHRISSQTGRELAQKHNVDYFEVSAKQGNGINEAFSRLTQLILNAQEKNCVNNSTDNDIVVLHNIPIQAKEKKQCCGMGGK